METYLIIDNLVFNYNLKCISKTGAKEHVNIRKEIHDN